MDVKLLEIRDEGTFIGAIAIRISKADGRLAWRCGYGETPCVLMTKLQGGQATYDPYEWRDTRTMRAAHAWVAEHWDEVVSGQVVDVQFILGETTAPKRPEC